MPELPEVEQGRRIAERTVAGRRIERVVCADDRIVFDGVAPAAFRRALTGRRVEAVRRMGKHLYFELDRKPWPTFHFGMTGSFRARDLAPPVLRTAPAEPDLAPGSGPEAESGAESGSGVVVEGGRAGAWPPRFTKVRFVLDDGAELVMTNARRLGRIRLREDPPGEPPLAGLGFDPLVSLPTPARFRDWLAGRRGTIKGLLLDQSFAAGVGNWIADEVLYRARVDPRSAADSLAPEEAERLRRALGSIVRAAVRVEADSRRFPRGWLFHRRWGRDSDARTGEGDRVEFLTVAGRTTAWVPARQSRGGRGVSSVRSRPSPARRRAR